jgi:hypothetical protein
VPEEAVIRATRRGLGKSVRYTINAGRRFGPEYRSRAPPRPLTPGVITAGRTEPTTGLGGVVSRNTLRPDVTTRPWRRRLTRT